MYDPNQPYFYTVAPLPRYWRRVRANNGNVPMNQCVNFVEPQQSPVSSPTLTHKSYNFFGTQIPYLELIPAPTPLHEGRYEELRFMIKREDLTDTTVYGGNKVRNLEFILADALRCGRERIATPIPVGSNFSAAFTAHAQRAGLDPMLCQILLASHPQIQDHETFCRQLGAEMTTRSGPLKFLRQSMDLAQSVLQENAYFVAPGGSTMLGVLGHMRAFFELLQQVKPHEVPDVIFVGAGTGGTTAGLLAAIALTRVHTKVIAVRCAERILCNKSRITRLSNNTLRQLGIGERVSASSFELIECPGNQRYGDPVADFPQIFDQFHKDNCLELDRTYTSKVVKAMAHHMRSVLSRDVNVLYWHTFSSMASKELRRRQNDAPRFHERNVTC